MDKRVLEQLLTGQHVRLWPYALGLFPRDILARVWRAMEAEEAWPRVFWWQTLPDTQKGDLAAFAGYMQHRIPLIVQDQATRHLAGLVWFDEAIQGLRCNISVWYRKTAWGAPAHEAGGIATRYAHQALGFPQVWGITPWRLAKYHALRCGYKEVATFPRYVRLNEKPMPLYFLCHEE